jgi:hypothetical protein
MRLGSDLVERRNRLRRAKTKQQNKRQNKGTDMKTTTLIHTLTAALLLSGSTVAVLAQDTATPTCPLGYEPGYGRTLTPEQRAEHQAAVQQLVTELRAKRDAGTITAEELAWLEQYEQRASHGNRFGKRQKANCPVALSTPSNGTETLLAAQGKGKGTGPKDGSGKKKGAGKGSKNCPASRSEAIDDTTALEA